MQFQCQFTQINCLVADSRTRSSGLSAAVSQSAPWHSALFGTWHFGTQLCLALGTLALSSVWHLALWHSALFGTWHSGTQLCLALGTLALEAELALGSLNGPAGFSSTLARRASEGLACAAG